MKATRSEKTPISNLHPRPRMLAIIIREPYGLLDTPAEMFYGLHFSLLAHYTLWSEFPFSYTSLIVQSILLAEIRTLSYISYPFAGWRIPVSALYYRFTLFPRTLLSTSLFLEQLLSCPNLLTWRGWSKLAPERVRWRKTAWYILRIAGRFVFKCICHWYSIRRAVYFIWSKSHSGRTALYSVSWARSCITISTYNRKVDSSV